MFKFAFSENDFFNDLESNIKLSFESDSTKFVNIIELISDSSILLEDAGFFVQADELVNFIEKLSNGTENDMISVDEEQSFNSKDDEISFKLNDLKLALESIDDFDNNISGILQDLVDVVHSAQKDFNNGNFDGFVNILKKSKSGFDYLNSIATRFDDYTVQKAVEEAYSKYNSLLSIL